MIVSGIETSKTTLDQIEAYVSFPSARVQGEPIVNSAIKTSLAVAYVFIYLSYCNAFRLTADLWLLSVMISFVTTNKVFWSLFIMLLMAQLLTFNLRILITLGY